MSRSKTRQHTDAHDADSRADRDDDPIGERIVLAAAEAIVAGGFAGATTESIARAARTSKRAIYQRYPDRAALFEQVMAHLCAVAGEGVPRSVGAEPAGLQQQVEAIGLAVLTRFAEPRVQRVLAAAVGATAIFPDALDVFWRSGPGQAVDALAALLEEAHAAGEVNVDCAEAAARSFILDCCGPLVLGQLFTPGAPPDREELVAIARSATARWVDRWRTGSD